MKNQISKFPLNQILNFSLFQTFFGPLIKLLRTFYKLWGILTSPFDQFFLSH